MDIKKENILKKVKALLNRNVKNGATLNEAEIAFRKASQLMKEYCISEQEVNDFQPTNFIESKIRMTRFGDFTTLVTAIADFFDCEFFWQKGLKRGTFFGYDVDVELCVYFYDIARNALESGLKNFKKSYEYHCALYNNSPSKLTLSYIRGFCLKLASKLDEMKKAQTAEILSTGTSLILVKKEIVESEFNKLHQDIKESSSRSIDVVESALIAGIADAKKVQFNKGIKEQENVLKMPESSGGGG